jgi:DNA-binding Lrp family transcriptional regulator
MYRISEPVDLKPLKLDIKDRKILTLLSHDARMPMTQISRQVMLSRDAVNYRINRLIHNNIILKFFPLIDYSKFGYKQFHIFLIKDERNKEKSASMMESLKNHPNVISVIEYCDRWDLEVVLIAKSQEDFDEVFTEALSAYTDIIINKEKINIIKNYYDSYVPTNVAVKIKMSDVAKPSLNEKMLEGVSLDLKDLNILKILSDDCRISSYKIGAMVKLSPDAVIYRIKRMYVQGIIKRFTIMTNISLLERQWYTFVIEMKCFSKDSESKLIEFARDHPHIMTAYKTFGRWDVMMYLATPTTKELLRTFRDIKSVFSDIVKSYEIWIAYKEHSFVNLPQVIIKDFQKQ